MESLQSLLLPPGRFPQEEPGDGAGLPGTLLSALGVLGASRDKVGSSISHWYWARPAALACLLRG